MNKLIGTIGILNVGEGDVKLSFDNSKPAERKRAAEIVADMLRKGFAILVHVGEKDGDPIYRRATKFDPKTNEYIIVGDPPIAEPPRSSELDDQARRQPPAKPKKTETRIPASRTYATAVSRSAGGYDPVLPARIRRGLKNVAEVIG